jgi:hypothetical protein
VSRLIDRQSGDWSKMDFPFADDPIGTDGGDLKNGLYFRVMIRRVSQAGLVICALVAVSQPTLCQRSLPLLLSQFRSQPDRESKERILIEITSGHPEAGPALLNLAREPENGDTNWLAIRGLGYLKFSGAEPFLLQSLKSNSVYIRANAARALGAIGDASAQDDLIDLLFRKQDNGVIE